MGFVWVFVVVVVLLFVLINIFISFKISFWKVHYKGEGWIWGDRNE